MKERIQKVLARFNLGSRRVIDDWIHEGKILVNQQVAQLGQRIDQSDHVVVNGEPFAWPAAPDNSIVLLFNKSEGILCSRKPTGKHQTLIFDHVPKMYRHFNLVGRLDLNSAGLIFLTNDGELLYRLTHPKYEVVRTYLVRVNGKVEDTMIEWMKKGIQIDQDFVSVHEIQSIKKNDSQATNQWFRMSLKEGKNREIRRIWKYFNCQVSHLIRIQYGPIHLPKNLGKNQLILMPEKNVAQLKQLVHLDSKCGNK